jgi:hypothetical protein
MEVSGQLHAPVTLPPGKQPWYPLYRGLGGPHSRSEHYGEEKNLLPLPGIKPQILDHGACSLVATRSELFQLNFIDYSNKCNKYIIYTYIYKSESMFVCQSVCC